MTIRVSTETAGKYYCKASVIGFPEIVAVASIFLKGPPTITSSRRQYGIVGDSTRIECVAFSVPKARHVSWTFMGHEIVANSNSEYTILEEPLPEGIKSTLVIRESQSKHFGAYNCTVVNEHGNDVLEIELMRRETSPILSLIVASASFVIIIMILVILILFCRKGKKKLKPADVIPDVSATYQPIFSLPLYSNLLTYIQSLFHSISFRMIKIWMKNNFVIANGRRTIRKSTSDEIIRKHSMPPMVA